MKKARVPEKDIQKQIQAYLSALRLMHWRMPITPVPFGSGANVRYGKSPLRGFPDLAGVLPGGRLFVIEVKAAGGKLRPEQEEWRLRLESAGVLYILAYGLQDVINGLKDQPRRY